MGSGKLTVSETCRRKLAIDSVAISYAVVKIETDDLVGFDLSWVCTVQRDKLTR
jgi:hypothetical protein